MATRQQKETQEKLNALEATMKASFGGKTSADFTKESLDAALAAVNAPLLALLWGIAPNRKGEIEASARNPRVNGEQALAIAAQYDNMYHIPQITAEVRARVVNSEQESQVTIPQGANTPNMSAIPGVAIDMTAPTDKAGLKQRYAQMNFGNFALDTGVIYTMYKWGEDILVVNPRKKRNKILKWTGIISGVAVGGFIIWKLVEAANDKVRVDAVDAEVDIDTPYVEVDTVDIGSIGHDEVSHASAFTNYR